MKTLELNVLKILLMISTTVFVQEKNLMILISVSELKMKVILLLLSIWTIMLNIMKKISKKKIAISYLDQPDNSEYKVKPLTQLLNFQKILQTISI